MKTFKKIYVEITSVCNLACSFCPPTKRAKQFIEVEQFINVLEQIKPYTNYLYFHVKGEPLLHPKLDQLLDISYEKGFNVNITTNGTLLKKAKQTLLMKPAIRQMNFSLHSFDGHRESSNRYDYITSILSFAKEAVTNTNMIISLRLWNLQQDNATNLEKKRNRETLTIIEKGFQLNYQIEEKVLPGKGIKIADRIYINQDHEFTWPSLDQEEDNNNGFCQALRSHVAILTNGTVVPCCLDGEGIINLGNIYERNFSEIIEDERANKLYYGFSKREAVEELCRKCGYRKRFG